MIKTLNKGACKDEFSNSAFPFRSAPYTDISPEPASPPNPNPVHFQFPVPTSLELPDSHLQLLLCHLYFDGSWASETSSTAEPCVPPPSIPVLLLVFTISGCDITSHPTAQIQNLEVIPDHSSKPHPMLVLAGSPSSIPPRSRLSCHRLCRLTEEASVLSPTKMGSSDILLFKFLL